jgi:sucrose-6-phosphate hydrolase SacC (GH32 family)
MQQQLFLNFSLILLSTLTLFTSITLADHICYDLIGNSCSCGPGCDQCSPIPFDQTTPQFHVRDLSCAENDPNFPFFDTKHNLYHLMYQDHLSEYQGGDGQGPDIGHAVSSDMVNWAHLPVSVWNDMPYDSVAIYTGSATIVNGIPTLVYPGLCKQHNWSSCDTGTLLAVAIPADHEGDPLLTNWTKPSYNPIVNNTQRDPSTAWQTAAGEWRLTNYEGKIYSSKDFVTWYTAGNGAVIFPVAECPDFFPIPSPCTGNGCQSSFTNDITPTHVHKQSSSGQDWYTLGVYTEYTVGE